MDQQSLPAIYAGRDVGHAQALITATNVGFLASFSLVCRPLASVFKQVFNIDMTTVPIRRKRARSRGRPVGGAEEDIRSALLDSAGKLFLKHGFERVTARQIAAAAGTTPAMIHYYFTNKLGLFRAMLDRAITPIRERLAGLTQQPDAVLDVPSLIALHMRIVSMNSWIPVFILNEVLVEKGRFRATFIREIASRQLPLVVQLLERGRASGHFRADLDPKLAALSLLSLSVFPFLSRPVTSQVLGLKYEGEELEQLITHTARLFLHGITNPPAESR